MKFIDYNKDTGEIKGFYDSDIHEVIPSEAVELNQDVWKFLLKNNGRYNINVNMVQGSINNINCLYEKPVEPLPPQPPSTEERLSAIEEVLLTIL